MRAHTRKPRTENQAWVDDVLNEDIPMSVDEAIKKVCGDKPKWAVALRGLRYREDLTQKQIGDALGIAQTNISKMERGERPIGKTIAKRIAKKFKIDYRIFL